MNQFKMCLKREWLELWRTKKFWFYAVFPIILVLFNTIVIFAMQYVAKSGADIEGLPQNAFSMSVMFYATYMLYYFFFVVFMQMGSAANEIRKRTWLIPENSGIKRSNLVLAKILVLGIMTVIPLIVGIFVNNLVAGLAYDNGPIAVTFSQILQSGICLLMTALLFTVLTVTLSAITGKRWIAAGATLVFMLVGSIALSYFKFSMYTPFMFYNSALMMPDISTAMWICSVGSSVVIMGVLIYLAMYHPARRAS